MSQKLPIFPTVHRGLEVLVEKWWKIYLSNYCCWFDDGFITTARGRGSEAEDGFRFCIICWRFLKILKVVQRNFMTSPELICHAFHWCQSQVVVHQGPMFLNYVLDSRQKVLNSRRVESSSVQLSFSYWIRDANFATTYSSFFLTTLLKFTASLSFRSSCLGKTSNWFFVVLPHGNKVAHIIA